MNNSAKLFDLKKSSQKAEKVLSDYKAIREHRETLPVVLGIVAIACGGVFSLVGAVSSVSLMHLGFVFLGIGVLAFAGLYVSRKVQGKSPSLVADREAANKEYRTALIMEMQEYGIDGTTLSARTTDHHDSFEFTAMRNGVLSDISIREYEGELVFMMNGERLRKASLVGA